MVAKVEKDNSTTRFGLMLYWLAIYVFSILFGGFAEAAADVMSKLILGFGTGELTARWMDIPLLLFAAILFSALLTWTLLTGEKLIRGPLEKTARWFKAFSLVFVFIGSHIFYVIIQLSHGYRAATCQ